MNRLVDVRLPVEAVVQTAVDLLEVTAVLVDTDVVDVDEGNIRGEPVVDGRHDCVLHAAQSIGGSRRLVRQHGG